VSTEREIWTLRVPEDVQRLIARAIRTHGRDKTFWLCECARASLAKKYGGKKTLPPSILKP
jgi:hypothetical protein